MEMGDLQAGERRQQPWRSASFLRKLLVGQGKAGDSTDATAQWEGRRLSRVLGSAPVHLAFQSWGPWMFRAVWPCVWVFPLPQREVSAPVQRPAGLCCSS